MTLFSPEGGSSPPERGSFTPEERRLVALLAACAFLGLVNFVAISPFLPEIAASFGSTVPLVGQVTTVLALASAALGLVSGPLADVRGHRRLLLVGIAAVALNLAGTAFAPNLPVLIGLAVVAAVGDSLLFGLPFAVAGERFSGDLRRRAVAWISAGLSLGVVVAPPLLAMIGKVVGWRGAMLVAAAVTLVTLVPATRLLPADAPAAGSLDLRVLADAYRPLLDSRPTLGLLAAVGLRAIGMIGPLVFFGAFVAERLGGGPDLVATAYLAIGLGILGGDVFSANLPGHWPLRPLAVAAIAVSSLLFGAFLGGEMPVPAALVLVAVAGFVSAVAWIALTTLLTQWTPAGTGTTMVLSGSLTNLGTAVGAAAGGAAIALGGYPALGVLVPVVTIPAALLVLWATSRQPVGAVAVAD